MTEKAALYPSTDKPLNPIVVFCRKIFLSRRPTYEKYIDTLCYNIFGMITTFSLIFLNSFLDNRISPFEKHLNYCVHL